MGWSRFHGPSVLLISGSLLGFACRPMWDDRHVAVEQVVLRAAPSEDSPAVETRPWGTTVRVWGQAAPGWVYSQSKGRVFVPESGLVRGTRITLLGWSPEEILEVRDVQGHRVVLRSCPTGRMGFILPEGSYQFLRRQALAPLTGLEPAPPWQNLDPRLEPRLGNCLGFRNLELGRGAVQTFGRDFQTARQGEP